MDLIVYDERDFVLCCKPIGTECEHELPALLAETLGGKSEDYYCIHRLDRAVGGLIVYARNRQAAAKLSEQMQQHTFQKEYLCICSGHFDLSQGEMTDYLYKDAAKGKSFTVSSPRRGVKDAALSYSVLAEGQLNDMPVSFVHVQLHTGRFHQIRCQFASRRHPLLGDGKYGSRERGCTVALWSHRITFRHPTSEKPCGFTLAPPDAFPWNIFPPLSRL